MRMKTYALAMTVAVLCVGSSLAVPMAQVATEAIVDADTHNDTQSTNQLGVRVEAHAYREGPKWWDYAKADAQSVIGGSIGAVAEVQGASGNETRAEATAGHIAEWVVRSETLSVGTPVTALLDVSFSGWLRKTYRTGIEMYSKASVALRVDGLSMYEGAAISYVERIEEPGPESDYTVIQEHDTSGAWTGDFVDDGFWVLDTTDRLAIDTVVGAVLELDLSLTVGAYLESVSEDDMDADFMDTGSYSFYGGQNPNTGGMMDVEFVMVPEPATMALLALGGIVFSKRRK